jgi:hypothetical protein
MPETSDTEYRFYPTVRTGIQPEKKFKRGEKLYPAGGRATATVTLSGEAEDGSTGTANAAVPLRVFGSGEVTGIDHRQVVRTFPKPDATDVPPNYFPFVEFDRPDLLWAFSPTSPDSDGRNLPWCCLVAVERDRVNFSATGPGPLPMLEAPISELPYPDEAWAWAHAQVVGPVGGEADDAAELAADSARTVSRLLCPRNLAGTASESSGGRPYIAAVVPTFEVGRRAGLGEPPYGGDGSETETTFAWDAESAGSVRLPVYYWWEFSTGPAGDFESLARELEPTVLGPDVGYRTVDVTAPGPETLKFGGDEGAGTIGMGGALRSAGTASDPYGGIEEQEQLADLLNAPESVTLPGGHSADAPGTSYGVVSPPKYGQWHAGISEVLPLGSETSRPGFDPTWFHRLNSDPAHRIAAGFGTEVIRKNQEQYMAEAWDQFGQLREVTDYVNRIDLAKAALGRPFGVIEDLDLPDILRITQPLHPHVFDPALNQTLFGDLGGGLFPEVLLTPQFQRLVRPSGPLARRGNVEFESSEFDSLFEARDVPTLGGGVSFTDGPIGADGDVTTPEGGGLLGEGGLGLPRLDFEHSLDVAVEEIDEQVAADALAETEHYYRSAHHSVRAVRRAVMADDAEPIQHLLDTPGISGDRLAGTEGDTPELLDASIGAIEEMPGTGGQATSSPVPDRRQRIRTEREQVAASVDEALAVLSSGGDRQEALSALARAERGLLDLTLTVGEARTIAVSEVSAETSSAVDAPPTYSNTYEELGAWEDSLVAEIDPEVRFPEIAAARLDLDTGGDPVESVMAEPRFDEAMYEALAALDQEYLLPGVGDVPRDSVGLVATNPAFIEAYMVGLNHEMARELRWRRFPTDKRGTYFRSFWDYRGNPERNGPAFDIETVAQALGLGDQESETSRPALQLEPDITPIHEWDENDLGFNSPDGDEEGSTETDTAAESDTAPESDTVLLIRGELLRRYPNATIYAAKAVGERRGDKNENESGNGDDDADDESVDRVPMLPKTEAYGKLTKSTDGEGIEFAKGGEKYRVRFPQFHGQLDPDITFLGFDLSPADALGEKYEVGEGEDIAEPVGGPQKNSGWFFVIEEPPTEPQFGLDEPSGDESGVPLEIGFKNEQGGWQVNEVTDEDERAGKETQWNALSWGHLDEGFGRGEGEYIRIGGGTQEKQQWRTPPAGEGADAPAPIVWGRNSADMARITWQRPIRIAIHADDLLPRDVVTDGSGESTEDGR